MAKLTTAQLVNRIYMFCLAYSGITFFPYQEQISKRIIYSVLDNDGEELSALQSRQSGKSEVISTTCGGLAIILPILANMPMFADDERLKPFKNGILIGVFAPAMHQAQISFSRMKQRMTSKSAIEVMDDPGILVDFDTNNGQNIALTNGSIITCMSASEGSNIEGKSYHIIIIDEAQDVGNFKYLKSISPMGAFYNATKILIGTPSTSKGFFYDAIDRNKLDYVNGTKKRKLHFEYDYKTVMKYNEKYGKYIEGEKRRLGEDSDEFQMAYNLKWILERGMFVTDDQLQKLGVDTLDISLSDMKNPHIVGVDLAKSSDSTVVTILEVDYENPVLIEKSDDMNIPDFYAYNTYIKNWLEIQGDDYESQYHEIRDFISSYRVERMVMDGTGVGSPIVDRFKANSDFEVIPYVFTTPSKSELYKRLDAEFKSGRMHYPAIPHLQETREYKKFQQQFLDLEKSYSGSHMVVHHPKVRGAHDDYCDSCALAVWGAMGEQVEKPTTEKKNVFREKSQINMRIERRNSYTARRR